MIKNYFAHAAHFLSLLSATCFGIAIAASTLWLALIAAALALILDFLAEMFKFDLQFE